MIRISDYSLHIVMMIGVWGESCHKQ